MKLQIVLGGKDGISLGLRFKNADIDFLKTIQQRYQYFLQPVFKNFSSSLNLELRFKNSFKTTGRAPQLSVKHNRILTLYRSDFNVNIDLKKHAGHGYIAPNIFSFDSLLRIIFSWLAVENKGFLLHSAGVVVKNRSFLFIGKTNSGKSTIAKKISREQVLSDELVLVKLGEKNNVFAYSTPFRGELEKGLGNKNAQVKYAFFLNKSDSSSAKKLQKDEVIKKLMPNILFFLDEKKYIMKILNTINGMLDSADFFDLFFTKKFKPIKLC